MSEHEKELREGFKAVGDEGAPALMDYLGLRLNALLEEHRRALVRARNEGLEKAAVKASNVGHVALAVVIRAMKEPE